MTKKHFEAIAAIIKAQYDSASKRRDGWEACQTIEHTADNLAEYFASQNPRFDELKFLQACGVCD